MVFARQMNRHFVYLDIWIIEKSSSSSDEMNVMKGQHMTFSFKNDYWTLNHHIKWIKWTFQNMWIVRWSLIERYFLMSLLFRSFRTLWEQSIFSKTPTEYFRKKREFDRILKKTLLHSFKNPHLFMELKFTWNSHTIRFHGNTVMSIR